VLARTSSNFRGSRQTPKVGIVEPEEMTVTR
jgi:hypothetical protein